ncbi:uncharacterized protein PADG_11612 [Paracoccidioides brasiliensis Pb18]|uniref:Uncharacterized protein n=1 Tax=Paracoccidioides brasiliensis (strain Pb18) TaxID=502780 RepID=A0A0A0HVL1_PARBD|nr:uncharacterized protein PADG_11612 [Paracoccidioides brasiliensis Pb18]KGM92408.1 hypothetical protein PADG_11612 [Paracoccidioides brasiliensis Pb18]ODH51202.1 hypothetical protein GX48_02629 [Paracoccidioides brasiliensis]
MFGASSDCPTNHSSRHPPDSSHSAHTLEIFHTHPRTQRPFNWAPKVAKLDLQAAGLFAAGLSSTFPFLDPQILNGWDDPEYSGDLAIEGSMVLLLTGHLAPVLTGGQPSLIFIWFLV